MREQPYGKVTLVFTDIEGSTRLLRELGQDAYREALGEHRRLVREAFRLGYEVDYEGDAFFYAFASAGEAMRAVAEAQRALAGGVIRIRVGVHTGEPGIDPPKYVGEDVHLAARVMSAGHGGQVVVSQTTAELVKDELSELGEHRLKDFDEPVSLFQLGNGSFPPLKTISTTNLPRPASSFVGRERDVAEVASLLRDGGRLITLTGPGGSGKTRLAIESAAELVPEFKAGVFWVGLASLRDPALVMEAIAQALGARGDLAEHIGEREMLLLVDNLEQVVEAAPELAALLEACPSLALLVTSRELLRVRGEVSHQVLPLATSDAVELFCARAGVEPSAAVEQLSRRLDNMPLALELAAARVQLLSVEQILERLSQRLDLFQGGRDADARQRTLRSTIEWSYELLTPAEQRLFACLAVFAGGCTLEAAATIADADLDTMQSLVEKSLVRRTDEHFWMLETIRDYAAERLEELREASELRERHAAYFFDVARRVDRELRGPDQEAWMERVARQHVNFAAAMTFYVDRGPAESALWMAAGLARYWTRRGAIAEGRALVDRALARASAAPPIVRANGLWAAAYLAFMQDDFERERALHGEAIDLFEKAGDSRGKLLSEIEFGWMELALGQKGDARRKADEAVAAARAMGDEWLLAFALQLRGGVLIDLGELEAATREYSECIATFEAIGDRRSVVAASSTLGWIALLGEEYEEAVSLLQTAVARSGADTELLAVNRGNLGLAHLFLGNDVQGAEEFSASLAHSTQMGSRRLAAESLLGLAAVAARASDLETAARLRSMALDFHKACQAPLNAVEQRVEERFLGKVREKSSAPEEPLARLASLDDAAADAAEVVAAIRSGREFRRRESAQSSKNG